MHSVRYLLLLYSFLLLTISLQAWADHAPVKVHQDVNCELQYVNQLIIVKHGPFELCLDQLGKVLEDEIKSYDKLQHSQIMFVIDHLVVSDTVMKNAILASNGVAIEFFLGENFFSNKTWEKLSDEVNFEFRINDNVIYSQGKGNKNLTVNLVETITLSQLLNTSKFL